MIKLIVAMDKNRVIGKDNDMPWKRELPNDLNNFKKLTLGNPMIMGRKTFESLPGILPERLHLMLTRSDLVIKSPFVRSFNDVNDILEFCKDKDAFVIGGSTIYQQFLSYVDEMHITKIDYEFEGDIYFPEIDMNNWQLISEEKYSKDNKNKYDYSFLIYKRKS